MTTNRSNQSNPFPSYTINENESGVLGIIKFNTDHLSEIARYKFSDPRFEIGDDGMFRLKEGVSLNYEEASELSLLATAIDINRNQSSVIVKVVVRDLNETPDVLLDNYDVSENDPGAFIAKLSTLDPDPSDASNDQGKTYSYQISDNRFEIFNGDFLRLKHGVAIDFETDRNDTILITSTDNTGYSVTKEVSLNFIDVNEPSTGLSLDNFTLQGDKKGAVVGKLTTHDPDTNDSFTYTVDDPRFGVDMNGQLKLYVLSSVAYEPNLFINLTVTSSDRDNHQVSKTFKIEVLPRALQSEPLDHTGDAIVYAVDNKPNSEVEMDMIQINSTASHTTGNSPAPPFLEPMTLEDNTEVSLNSELDTGLI